MSHDLHDNRTIQAGSQQGSSSALWAWLNAYLAADRLFLLTSTLFLTLCWAATASQATIEGLAVPRCHQNLLTGTLMCMAPIPAVAVTRSSTCIPSRPRYVDLIYIDLRHFWYNCNFLITECFKILSVTVANLCTCPPPLPCFSREVEVLRSCMPVVHIPVNHSWLTEARVPSTHPNPHPYPSEMTATVIIYFLIV